MPVLARPEPDATELVATRCSGCGETAFPQLPACPVCFGGEQLPHALSGLGTLYSYTRVHVGKLAEDGPSIVAYVDTDEGARVFATVEASDHLTLGARVRLIDAIAPPTFEVIEGDAGA